MKKEFEEKIKNSKKNLFVYGDMASGKTKHVMFPIVDMLIREHQNLFLLDTKGEYISEFYEKLKSEGYEIKILELADWRYSTVHKFSLFQQGSRRSVLDQLFFKVSQRDEELGEKVKLVFEYICDCFWENQRAKEEKGFQANDLGSETIYQCFLDPKKIRQLLEKESPLWLSTYYDSHRLLLKEEEIEKICYTICEELREYHQVMRVVDPRHEMNIEELYETPTVIFCRCDGVDHTINRIANVLIQYVYDSVKEMGKKHCHFVLDDFLCLDELVHLNDMLRSALACDMRFYIASQSIEEVRHLYHDSFFRACDQVKVGRQLEWSSLEETMTFEKEEYVPVQRVENKSVYQIENDMVKEIDEIPCDPNDPEIDEIRKYVRGINQKLEYMKNDTKKTKYEETEETLKSLEERIQKRIKELENIQ